MYCLIRWISVGIILIGLSACTSSYSSGEQVYKTKCVACHMVDGTGLGQLIPPLKNSDYLKTHFKELPCIILLGLRDSIVVNGKHYAEWMPPVEDISKEELSNLINYIQKEFLDDKTFISSPTIEKWSNDCMNVKR